jgi:hypothetical protein
MENKSNDLNALSAAGLAILTAGATYFLLSIAWEAILWVF